MQLTGIREPRTRNGRVGHKGQREERFSDPHGKVLLPARSGSGVLLIAVSVFGCRFGLLTLGIKTGQQWSK
jgi:hypothetical protein